MIKELQVDPTTDEILHIDLIRISMDKPIRVTVPVVHSGEPIGVKTEGGFVDFVTREVEVECLPRDIPESIGIDIADLHIHQSFKVENMTLPAGVRIITDPDTVLVMISLPHKEEEFPRREARRRSRRRGSEGARGHQEGAGQGRGRGRGEVRRRRKMKEKKEENSLCGWSWAWGTRAKNMRPRATTPASCWSSG